MGGLWGGGGGGQRLCWPPSQIIGWGGLASPLPTPGGGGGGGGGKAMLAPLSNYWVGGAASLLPTPMQINALVRLNCIQLSSVGSDR